MDKFLELAFYRLDRAREDLDSAEILYKSNKLKAANNRAYYSIFHSIRAILALDNKDFKRHKDVIAYFNQYYVSTEIFPKIIGKKIGLASSTREDSDYDDKFIAKTEDTFNQIETAKELINLTEKYLNERKATN